MVWIAERPVLPRTGRRHYVVAKVQKPMSHDVKFMRRALQAAAMLAAVATFAPAVQAARAAKTTYNVYTLTVGDSSASFAQSIFFDGQYIWVGVQNPDGGALLKMTQSGTLLSTTGVGTTPIEMAYDGANIWVSDYTSSDVTVVNESGTVLATIPLPGANPEGILFDGKDVWTANNGFDNGPYANTVSKFDVSSISLMATYRVGLNPDGVAFDGTVIWVTNSYNNNVWTIDRNTGAHISGWGTGTYPLSIVYDGANMWIGNGINTGSVTKIRAADGAILGTYATAGTTVRGLIHEGTSIWVCNSGSNTVSRLRADNVALLGTYATGPAPRSVAFDGTRIWVANSGANTLTVIAPPSASPPGSGLAPIIVAQPALVQPKSLAPVLKLLLAD